MWDKHRIKKAELSQEGQFNSCGTGQDSLEEAAHSTRAGQAASGRALKEALSADYILHEHTISVRHSLIAFVMPGYIWEA
jgi:hypothetical protein